MQISWEVSALHCAAPCYPRGSLVFSRKRGKSLPHGIRHPFLAKLGLGGTDSPHFCMGRDCLWDSEEQNREWNRMYILCFAPRCPRGSLVPYKNGEQISCAVHFQSCFLLSQRQSVSSHTEVRSISSVGLFLRRERYVRDATQHQNCMARLNPMQ